MHNISVIASVIGILSHTPSILYINDSANTVGIIIIKPLRMEIINPSFGIDIEVNSEVETIFIPISMKAKKYKDIPRDAILANCKFPSLLNMDIISLLKDNPNM